MWSSPFGLEFGFIEMNKLVILLCSLLWGALSANAIYVEDAFVADWQLESIGPYQCVFEDGNQQNLIIISKYDSGSLISFVNQTDGRILFRHPLKFRAVDAMLLENGSGYVLKDNTGSTFTFDSTSGFPLDAESFNGTFTSTCVPKQENVNISKDFLQLIDRDSRLEILKVPLNGTFAGLNFFHSDGLTTMKFLYSTLEGYYVFQCFENGVLHHEWSRDESIHDVTAHAFFDIPNEKLLSITNELLVEQDISNIWGAYKYRVAKNWGRFKSFLKENQYSPGKIITKLMRMDSKLLNGSDDVEFGLAKYLIVASKEGSLAAVDSSDGARIWTTRTDLQDIIFLDFIGQRRELFTFAADGAYALYDVSNATRPVLSRKDKVGNVAIDSISKLDEGKYFLKLENGSKQLFSLISSTSTAEINVITTHDKKGVYGMILKDDGLLQDTWKISLKESEEIVAYAARADVPVANIGVTLGNRTVLYKYLYPNLASYVVSDEKSGSIFVHLIDTITGELLYSQFHDEKVDHHAPINIVFSENWFVYSFFSSVPLPEQKLVVVELYESLEADSRVSSPSGEYNSLKSVNKPKTISNAYFFPEVIKRMTVSSTRYQISVRAVILELENGQMTYLSKAILSARRVEESKMTDNDKKEFMAMPYISTIPLNDHFIITHSRNLLMGENAQLVSIATNLESTSIICGIGHDIFCTKIYPSGQFDTMSPSFEKGKLLATILGLFVLCYLLRPSVETAKLKSQWLVRS